LRSLLLSKWSAAEHETRVKGRSFIREFNSVQPAVPLNCHRHHPVQIQQTLICRHCNRCKTVASIQQPRLSINLSLPKRKIGEQFANLAALIERLSEN